VLVIDDSLTTRMLDQSILESAGYAVHVAVSGEEGLEQARRQPYALFLVDVECPAWTVFTFIERNAGRSGAAQRARRCWSRRAHRPRIASAVSMWAPRPYVVKSEFAQSEFLERVRQLVQEAQ